MTSEKGLPTNTGPVPSTRPKSTTRRALVWTGAALLGYHAYANRARVFKPQFIESTVAGGITWWACPDITTTECAYLTVPRDYANPQANDTVSIFLRKVPATVAPKDYLGSILINPGGPGGSGSAFAATRGLSFRDLTDGRYDIIGFDPRGVNMTIPELNCFGTETQGLHSMYKQFQLGIPYDARGPESLPAGTRAASEHTFVRKLATSAEATHAACQTHGNHKMLEAVSTALVVQDMERIVEALGEDGLNFWGFSYGTILGSTFAAMRPHLVKRMVLDGVSDADSYHNDIYQWGRDGLTDTHKTLSGFFDACASAGPDRCAFAKHPNKTSSSSAADLRSRLEALYTRLRERPMAVPYSAVGPGILTASDAKLVMFMGLYAPKRWPQLAQMVADAENDNPKAMYENAYGAFADLHPEQGNKNIFNRYMEKTGLAVSTSSIMCGDSAPANWKSFDDFVEYFHELASIGPIGENWALWTGFCRQWKFRPVERYDGPWDKLKKTRFPILYTSLDADPVTPLSAAIKMSEAFGNQSAVLLVQEGFGHCTLAHPSLCTAKILKEYFVQGKVPAPGTKCKPEPGCLFPGNDTQSISTLSAEDQSLWRALDGLSDLGGKCEVYNERDVGSGSSPLTSSTNPLQSIRAPPKVLTTDMVVLTPKFASLLAFVMSSSILAGVDALPYQHEHGSIESALGQHLPLPAIFPRPDASSADVEARGHHHHKGHHHHGGHGTKVYADDPLIISGNGNHVHAHSHKRHSHHGHHGHHHPGTKVHADDPLVVSGNKNHVHSHTHKRADSQLVSLGTRKNHHHHHHHHQGKAMELTAFKRGLGERGLLDPLIPLAGGLPGVAGVIGLIISSSPSAMSIQSAGGNQMPSYTINASNSSSTTMYLVAQNATANVGPSEQIVLITMPMLNSTDQSVKMYCASYDPNSPTASQLSSQPCSYNPNSGLDINSTSTHLSQLFSWNINTGEISPLWQKSPNTESTVDTASAPGGTNPAGGYVIGSSAPETFSAQQSGSGGKLAMVFKLASFPANNATAAPPASSVEPGSVMTWSDDCDEETEDSQTGNDGQTDASSDDYEACPSTSTGDATNGSTTPEDIQAYDEVDATSSAEEPSSSPTETVAAQETTVVTSTLTILVGPTESVASPTTPS